VLRPSKHSHPDQTVIYVSLLLLARLKKQRIASYADLRDLAKSQVRGGELLFMPALSFLFLFGLVEYRRKPDAFEYQGPT
jgi:hypothetical protein